MWLSAMYAATFDAHVAAGLMYAAAYNAHVAARNNCGPFQITVKRIKPVVPYLKSFVSRIRSGAFV